MTTVRISGPAGLITAIPHLLGFHPDSSVVVLGLDDSTRRVCITMRYDLPDGDDPGDDMLGSIELGLDRTGATSACIVVYPSQDSWPASGDPLPEYDLAETLEQALQAHGVAVLDTVCSIAGRWRSYACEDLDCCPPGGRPVDESTRLDIDLLLAMQGSAPFPDRAAALHQADPLPDTDPATVTVRNAAARYATAPLVEIANNTMTALHASQAAPEDSLAATGAGAWMAAAATTITSRDLVLHRITNSRDHGIILTAHDAAGLAARTAEPECRADTYAVYAVLSWLIGDGLLARAAIGHALDADPGQRLARLVESALDHATPPQMWVDLMADLTEAAILEAGQPEMQHNQSAHTADPGIMDADATRGG